MQTAVKSKSVPQRMKRASHKPPCPRQDSIQAASNKRITIHRLRHCNTSRRSICISPPLANHLPADRADGSFVYLSERHDTRRRSQRYVFATSDEGKKEKRKRGKDDRDELAVLLVCRNFVGSARKRKRERERERERTDPDDEERVGSVWRFHGTRATGEGRGCFETTMLPRQG